MTNKEKIRKAHYFFTEHTPDYIGKKETVFCMGDEFLVPRLSIRQKLYYPIAYIKFMWLVLRK